MARGLSPLQCRFESCRGHERRPELDIVKGNTILRYECDVCGNSPDEEGLLEHGRGCYVVDSDGGGLEFISEDQYYIVEEPPEKPSLDTYKLILSRTIEQIIMVEAESEDDARGRVYIGEGKVVRQEVADVSIHQIEII
jgi:hypothetical protein